MSTNPPLLDEQQAQLIELLRAAGGAPVTFDELRGVGIENPALLCYELEAAGVPITRTASPAEGMPAMSARLDAEPEAVSLGGEGDPSAPNGESFANGAHRGVGTAAELAVGALAGARAGAVRITGAMVRWIAARRPGVRKVIGDIVARVQHAAGLVGTLPDRSKAGPAATALGRRRPSRRGLAATLALLVAFATVIAIALGDLAPGRGHHASAVVRSAASASRKRSIGRAPAGAGAAQPAVAGPTAAGPVRTPPPSSATSSAPAAGQPATSAPAPTGVSSAAAEGLEAQGHALLLQGSYASAIPVLSSAVRSSGQSLATCAEPESEACLTFAYALYDLGHALRLAGHHAEAISVLSERLRIDNQRPTVQHELELARGARA